LKDVHGFAVNLRLWNTGKHVDIALATDFDDQIAARIKGVPGADFTKLQSELKSKLDGKRAAKRKEFEDFYASKKDAAEKQLSAVKSQIDQQTAALDAKKKELTDRLEKEKKAAIDKTLRNILK